MSRLLTVVSGVAAAAILTTGVAFACVPHVLSPSRPTAAAIAAAVRASPLTKQVPSDDYTVTGIRLSASDPAWAWVQLRPRVTTVGPADGIEHHTARGWKLAELGTFEVGCGLAPSRVLHDFGVACPPAP
ncbi:MAG: hypothetical protein ACQSGP_06635 [Frankia sp.]